jgi:hypothetical protein
MMSPLFVKFGFDWGRSLWRSDLQAAKFADSILATAFASDPHAAMTDGVLR